MPWPMRQQATRQRAERLLSIRTRCEIPREPTILGTLPPAPSGSTEPSSRRVPNLHAQPETSRTSVQEGQPGTPCLFRSYFARPSSGRPSSGRRNHLVLDREPPRLRPPSRGPLRIWRTWRGRRYRPSAENPKIWIAHDPDFDVMGHGSSQKAALPMLNEAMGDLVNRLPKFSVWSCHFGAAP